MAENIGKVISISGPAVDVQFEEAQMPPIFQALRIVEHVAAEENQAARKPPPDPAGRGVDPANTAMRIRSAVPLGYAASEVLSVRRPRNSDQIELTQTVVGLTGTSGVLPHAFSELVHVSVRERNPGLRDFLDIFNSRLAGLLFEAWSKHRLAVERDLVDGHLAGGRAVQSRQQVE